VATPPMVTPPGAGPHTFNVHCYNVFHKRIESCPGPTYLDAIEQARNSQLLDNWNDWEPAEEIAHFLVDVVGDEEYGESQFFDDCHCSAWPLLQKLLLWSQTGRNPVKLEELLIETHANLMRYVSHYE